MGTLRSIRGGRKLSYHSQLLSREPAWEIRQLYTPDGVLAGDLLLLYAPSYVRAVVLLRKAPPTAEWELLDSWVLSQIDNYERRYVVDYYQGSYITGLEGPPERPLGEDDEDSMDDME